MGGEQLVEASETGGRDRAVALRHRDERRLEVSTEVSVLAEIWVQTARPVTQPDDLAANRERLWTKADTVRTGNIRFAAGLLLLVALIVGRLLLVHS